MSATPRSPSRPRTKRASSKPARPQATSKTPRTRKTSAKKASSKKPVSKKTPAASKTAQLSPSAKKTSAPTKRTSAARGNPEWPPPIRVPEAYAKTDPDLFRVLSWNVNGMRSCKKKGFDHWLETCQADCVAIQEVRATKAQMQEHGHTFDGWHEHWHSAERLGYSGVGLLSRHAPDDTEHKLGVQEFDAEGRYASVRIGNLRVVSAYFPNGAGKNRDNSRIPFKLAFYRRVFDLLEGAKERGERILVVGDFNTAHEPIDLARPKQNEKTSGFTPVEREEFARWLEAGWIDTFRRAEPAGGHYTWWSQRFGVREKNIGWRIDYVLASPAAEAFVRRAYIHPAIWGSDHAPIGVDLDPAILR